MTGSRSILAPFGSNDIGDYPSIRFALLLLTAFANATTNDGNYVVSSEM